MKEKPWIIDALLQAVVITLLCAVLMAINSFTAKQERSDKRRFRAEAILEQIDPNALLAAEPVRINHEELATAFRSLRIDMYRITFANYVGGDDECARDAAIARLQRGLALADQCEKQIAGEGDQ